MERQQILLQPIQRRDVLPVVLVCYSRTQCLRRAWAAARGVGALHHVIPGIDRGGGIVLHVPRTCYLVIA